MWNYNESLEDTWTGVKHIRIVVDGQLMTPMDGVLVRKAPGTATFDFGQFVPLQAASAGDGVSTDAGSNRDGGHHKANGRSDGARVSRLERGASMPSHITHGSRQVAAVVSPSHAASHKRQMSQSLGYGAANASLARGIVAAASQAAAELRNRASRSHRADNHDDDAPSGGDPSPGGPYSFSDQAPRNDTDDGAVKSASPVSPLGEAGRFAQFSLAGSKGRGTAATAAVAVPAPSAPLRGVHMDYSDSDSSDDGMDVAPTSFTRALLPRLLRPAQVYCAGPHHCWLAANQLMWPWRGALVSPPVFASSTSRPHYQAGASSRSSSPARGATSTTSGSTAWSCTTSLISWWSLMTRTSKRSPGT